MQKKCFEVKEQFYLDGQPFQVISGSIHYFRVVPAYWRDRLEKLRAMGCNTVETYVPWNLHEPKRGKFEFDGMLDIAAFLRTAQEVGLYAIVRPSPYICGEWEFGGLPAWLLADDGMRLRSTYAPYLDAVRAYYRALFSILTPLQIDRGGPILMMQVENEYGAYGDETAYLEALRDEMRKNGVTVPLVTSDGPWGDYLENGSVQGALPTANFGSKPEVQLPALQRHVPHGPLLCMEFWNGWFDAWGDAHHHTASAQTAAKDLDVLLSRGNVNFYMFHGGTNFGFMNGANDYGHLSPDVTSYDYDAPLAEDGSITPKYLAFREVISRHAPVAPMHFTTQIKKRAYGTWPVDKRVSLDSVLEDLTQPVQNPWPLSMEKLGQNYGYTLYRSGLRAGTKIAHLQLLHANDRAQIFLDGKWVKTLYDRELCQECALPATGTEKQISILVENMGRVNYGPKMNAQRKGIAGDVLLNGTAHAGWDMFPLSMEQEMLEKIDFSKPYREGTPAFYHVAFSVETPGDTFLELSGWGKGIAVLNGFVLGRFWKIGPQKRLYLPAPLLRPGENDLLLFETEGQAAKEVSFFAGPDLG